jgi:hypothetical protein
MIEQVVFAGKLHTLLPPTPGLKTLNFFCHEQIGTNLGVSGLLVNGTIMEIPGLCGPRRMTIRGATIEGDTAEAFDDQLSVSLERIDGEWRATCWHNLEGLKNIKFV